MKSIIDVRADIAALLAAETLPEAVAQAVETANARPSPVDAVCLTFNALRVAAAIDAQATAVLRACAEQIVEGQFWNLASEAQQVLDATA